MEERCVDLCTRGFSYRQIGKALGCSHQTVFRHVRNAMDRIIDRTNLKIGEWRTLELEKLALSERKAMAILEAEHVLVQGGKVVVHKNVEILDDGPVLAAIDRLVRICERRSRLLGLDAPTYLTIEGLEEQIERLEREAVKKKRA